METKFGHILTSKNLFGDKKTNRKCFGREICQFVTKYVNVLGERYLALSSETQYIIHNVVVDQDLDQDRP